MIVVNETAGEHIDSENWILPAYFRGIEGARVVIPAQMTEQALVAIREFLTAEFDRERKLLVIADENKRLVNIHRAVTFGQTLARPGRGIPFVADRIARPTFERGGEHFSGESHPRHHASQRVRVVVIVLRAGGKIPVGTDVGETGVVLDLLSDADVDADIPGAEVNVGGAEPLVDEPREGTCRGGRHVLGVRGRRERSEWEEREEEERFHLAWIQGGIRKRGQAAGVSARRKRWRPVSEFFWAGTGDEPGGGASALAIGRT